MLDLIRACAITLGFLLLAIGACSCSGYEPLGDHAAVDLSALTPEDRAAALAAGVSWYDATGTLGIHDDPDARLAVRYTANPDVLGIWYAGKGLVGLRAGLGFELARHVMLHELGHVWGLEHAGSGLMQPSIQPGHACIDLETVQAVCAIRRCSRAVPTCAPEPYASAR